jgi:hypothetical protein
MAASNPAKIRGELRVRIGRQRRRIDRRLRSVGQEGRRLVSWRTYLTRHPAWALAVLGAGMAGAASLQRGRWPRRSSLTLFRRLGGMFLKQVLNAVAAKKGVGVPVEPTAAPSTQGGRTSGT